MRCCNCFYEIKKNIRDIFLRGMLLMFTSLNIESKVTILTGNESEDTVYVQGYKQKDSVNQTDILEVIAKALNLKHKSDSEKYEGKGPFISVIPAFGYSLESGYTGVLSFSASFYTSSNRSKFSNISTNADYSLKKQFWIVTTSDIFFDKLRLHLFGDWRFYKFPTKTFGIGNKSSFADVLSIDYKYVRFYQIFFREVSKNVFTGIGYHLDYHWKIIAMPPLGRVYGEIQSFNARGSKSVSSGISLNFKFDNRKNSVNPKGGSYFNIQIQPSFISLGSDKNWQSVLIDLRHYVKLPLSSRNILALWTYNEISLGRPPYLDLPSIGWDDNSNTGRGNIPGRYTGRNLFDLETEYRFSLTKNGLFGVVIFGNITTYPDKYFSKLRALVPAGGFGLRIKVNKYSDANLAIDYGFSKGTRGFFFNLGEAF